MRAPVWVVGVVLKMFKTGFDNMNQKNIERNRRLDALEQRLTSLEARPAVKFAGVHQDGQSYSAGDMVQRSGLWVCKVDGTVGKPGEDYNGWSLVLKQR